MLSTSPAAPGEAEGDRDGESARGEDIADNVRTPALEQWCAQRSVGSALRASQLQPNFAGTHCEQTATGRRQARGANSSNIVLDACAVLKHLGSTPCPRPSCARRWLLRGLNVADLERPQARQPRGKTNGRREKRKQTCMNFLLPFLDHRCLGWCGLLRVARGRRQGPRRSSRIATWGQDRGMGLLWLESGTQGCSSSVKCP
jgi:hypothetical protein